MSYVAIKNESGFEAPSLLTNAKLRDAVRVRLRAYKENERRVIALRYAFETLRPMSLDQISEICGLTRQDAHRIEKDVIARLRAEGIVFNPFAKYNV